MSACFMQSIIYAGQVMRDEDTLADYKVPPVSLCSLSATAVGCLVPIW